MIAAPAGPGLDRKLVLDIAASIGADLGQADWLSETHAVDLPLGEALASPIAAQTQELARANGADFVVQQAAARRKSVLLADMDSTMIEQECIDELAAEIGIKDAVAGITARAMNGEIDFEPALRERVALLKGLPEDVIAKVIDERITLASGGPTLIATMRANGAYTALVSGGFTAFTRVIAARLGFDGNRLGRTNCFAEFASDAAFLTIRIPPKGVLTTKARAQGPFFKRIIHRDLASKHVAKR